MKEHLLMNADSWDHSYKKFKTSGQFHIEYYEKGLQVTIYSWTMKDQKL